MLPASRLSAFLLLPAAITAISYDCNHIVAGGQSFDLSALSGEKSVHHPYKVSPAIYNTTFAINICNKLERPADVPKEELCEDGTRICATTRIFNDGTNLTNEVFPVAGQYTTNNGKTLDPKFTRLKDSDSHSDAKQEGLRAELHGGYRKMDKRDQKAFIEFICDKEKTGNEGFEDEQNILDIASYNSMRRRKEPEAGDGEDGEDKLPNPDDEGKALQLDSYQQEGDSDVLRLTWRTKYACEDAAGSGGSGKQSGGWGFFTWLLIIVFLLAASYIIFGSWLNYNRYGARGWDLIPHGDTIRDLPYLVKDFGSSVMDKLRGGNSGSRGGYSAV